jgi:hypothetical protein
MNIEQLQQQAQLAYDHELARRNIKQQMESRLTVNHRSGVFKVDTQLICFLSSWTEEEFVLLDSYETPIMIDRAELLTVAKQRYKEIMNEWHLAWEDQVKIRSAKNV